MDNSIALAAHKLSGTTDLTGFSCGRDKYDEYIFGEAHEDQKERVGQVWLFYHNDKLVGYVSLAMSQLDKNQHQKLGGITGHGHIPGLLLGQMARHKEYRGKGIGLQMINWVIGQAVELSERIGCRLIILQSEDDKVECYKDAGFVLIPKSNRKKNIMFLNLLPYFEPPAKK